LRRAGSLRMSTCFIPPLGANRLGANYLALKFAPGRINNGAWQQVVLTRSDPGGGAALAVQAWPPPARAGGSPSRCAA
jgi:hypothetical protein